MPDAVSTQSLALPTWSYKLKKAAWIGLGIIGFLFALILIGPHFVDLGLFKRTYLPLVEEALNRRLDVGEVRLSLVPTPSIRLSNLKVFDPPAFAENTFFSAEQVRLRLKLWPLLKGRFEVTELLLDKPVFNLLKQPDGTFNYSDIATKKPPAGTRRETRKKSEARKAGGNGDRAGLDSAKRQHQRRPDQSADPRSSAGQYKRHRSLVEGILQ